MRKFIRLLCVALVLLGALAITGGVADLVVRPAPAYADGPVACGPTTQPAFPYAGFCANYNSDVTWYGTYGPGFPTAQGFGMCADPPASGGDFPAPSYDYTPGAAPPGAGGDWNALGFAFSEGQANGWWGGVPGRFTADQVAAAAKILYDAVVWGSPVPAMDPGVLAAYDAFDNWFNQAVGMSNATPQLFVGLTSSSTSFTGSATDDIHLQFPGTGSPMVGQGVLLSITNGTFNSPGGPTSIGGERGGAAKRRRNRRAGADPGARGAQARAPTRAEGGPKAGEGAGALAPGNLRQARNTPEAGIRTHFGPFAIVAREPDVHPLAKLRNLHGPVRARELQPASGEHRVRGEFKCSAGPDVRQENLDRHGFHRANSFRPKARAHPGPRFRGGRPNQHL